MYFFSLVLLMNSNCLATIYETIGPKVNMLKEVEEGNGEELTNYLVSGETS